MPVIIFPLQKQPIFWFISPWFSFVCSKTSHKNKSGYILLCKALFSKVLEIQLHCCIFEVVDIVKWWLVCHHITINYIISLFIHSPVDRCMDFLQLWLLWMNLLWAFLHNWFWWYLYSFLLDKYIGIEFLSHSVGYVIFPKMIVLLYIYISNIWETWVLKILTDHSFSLISIYFFYLIFKFESSWHTMLHLFQVFNTVIQQVYMLYYAHKNCS